MSTYGINFRNTSGFVVDESGQTYDLGEVYPTTRGGLTFGWEDGDRTVWTRDRDSGSPYTPKLSGCHLISNTTSLTMDWKIDLSGTFKIRLALGDASSARSDMAVEIRDSIGSKFSLSNLDSTGANFFDASGVELTPANWYSSNMQSIEYTFSGFIRFRFGNSTEQTDYTSIAHIEIEEVLQVSPQRIRVNGRNVFRSIGMGGGMRS